MKKIALSLVISLLSFNVLSCDFEIDHLAIDIKDKSQYSVEVCRLLENRMVELSERFNKSDKLQQQNQEKYTYPNFILSLQLQLVRDMDGPSGQVLIRRI
ncbi:hypothetical protein HBN50_01060 [Halobacteriovorax sp. GB3]|uniref:hypothetical protein n=1 Tax=Halobacteriovorax sp. GB3 TaxID=2719615 RepID=UPI0023602C2A|nr:hypothetical protein [Halobacteriovorax sp. GB3]MDD0851656.1 hypothetical protein [Halobacteriovorax sp. GB3]